MELARGGSGTGLSPNFSYRYLVNPEPQSDLTPSYLVIFFKPTKA
jgi:hypothetical protein